MPNEYASTGLIGLLTPQANVTAEAECRILLPRGASFCTARMTSAQAGMHERLVAYAQELPQTVRQFAGMPLTALAFACTGSSYLLGAAAEDALFAGLSARLGFRATGSALAIVAALQDLGAADIAIVSPYDDRLTQASGDYWASRGLRVRQVVRVEARSVHGAEPHPIYGLNSEAATDALGRVDAAGCDAVVMLGTGMPTLGAVRQAARLQGKPVLSSMLALVWDALRDGHAGQACSAADWIDRGHWHAAYDAQRMPAAALPA